MPIDDTKNKRLVIVVSHDTAKAIEALAKKDRRPMSAYVRNILEDHAKAAELKEMVSSSDPESSGSMGIFPPPEL
ncbi:hypothetical protein OAK87_01420 [bacterium]|nr:hypothetical protein [bacterium]